ncbi:unnamed protein product [Phaedon cochleariae]|uniref:RING-type domain-containing protein n=1 Tax=Phaedon cochleariae TaxID=80249 RepID=A0A9P0GQF3_PHACE|nr:unnamed protein product [Phaedon cochleariae]
MASTHPSSIHFASELQNAMLSFKCWLCENLLSVPPIMVLSKDGKQLKCGRCKNNEEKPSICRNFAFENVAMFSSVPCMYKDCNKITPWKEVERHEDACDKKTIKCPIYYEECEGIFQVDSVVSHCRRFHADKIFFNTFNYELSTHPLSRMICFLAYNGDHPQNFILMIINTFSSSEVYVASLKEIDECFRYDLKLSSTKNGTSVTYEDQPISKYVEMDHCLTCMVAECDLPRYPHTKMQQRIPVNIHFKKIDLTVMKPLFGDISKIKFTITIVPKEKYSDSSLGTVNQCLKKELCCPICMEYMISEIYNCEKGHVLCNTCKIQLTECPSCGTNIGESRSFPLENLADEVVLTCLFYKNGCKFTGKLKSLSSHEKECVHKQDSNPDKD